jgi:DNA-binding transcriptional MerR regulator
MMTTQEHLTIQQVSERTGLSVHTLRYYERIGLLAPVSRAANGHRRYSIEDVNRVQFLNKMRATGMPIRKLCEFAALYAEGDDSLGERIRVLEEHRQTVLETIAELQRSLGVIEFKIDLYKTKEAERCKNETSADWQCRQSD